MKGDHHFILKTFGKVSRRMVKRGSRSKYRLSEEEGLDVVIARTDRLNEILAQIAKNHAKNLAELAKEVQEIKEELEALIPKLKLRKVDYSLVKVAATDAGANGKDLLFGYQPVTIAVGMKFVGSRKASPPTVATIKPLKGYFDDEEGAKYSTLVGYYLQYRLALNLLKDVDVVLLDGPLYPPKNYYSPRGRAHSPAYHLVYEKTYKSLAELLRRGKEEDKPVIGVVKRVRSTSISSRLGLGRIPDNLLVNVLAEEGQAVGPVPLNSKWEDVLIWLGDNEGYDPWSIFVRRRKPFRIDLPRYALPSAETIANLLYSTADPRTGIPIQIVAVDRISKVTERHVSLLYKLMISELRKNMSPEEIEELAIFSLQRGEEG